MFQTMNLTRKPISLLLLFLHIQSLHSYPTVMNCTDTTRLCTSYLAFKPTQNQTLPILQSMFDVLPEDITIEQNGHDYVFIKKNCSCASPIKNYLTNTTFTMRSNDGFAHDVVIDAYDGLAFMPNSSRKARAGAVVPLQLFCGCSSGLWNYLMSYVLREGDSVESLSSRFGVSMDNIETVNGINYPDNVTVGELYYIPLNSVPGEPYPLENDLPPAPASPIHNFPACFAKSQGRGAKGTDGKIHHNFHILRTRSFCRGSGRYICCTSGDRKQTNGESSDRNINVPKALGTDVFDMEKPLVFTYEEILSSTNSFSESNLMGQGTYGSVYYGLLRDQEVAIKRMTALKTKEFMAEMKVLCKVHHQIW